MLIKFVSIFIIKHKRRKKETQNYAPYFDIMLSVINFDSNVLGKVTSDKDNLQCRNFKGNAKQLIEELKNVSKSKDIIYSIIKHMLEIYIPSDIAVLLIGISTSQEIHQIYQAAGDYIINVLHLYQYLQDQKQSISHGVQSLPEKQILQYEQAIALTSTDDFMNTFKVTSKSVGIKTLQKVFKHIQTQHTPFNIKNPQEANKFTIFKQEFKLRNCILTFDNLATQYSYTHDSLQVLLEYGLAANEIIGPNKEICQKYLQSAKTQHNAHQFILSAAQLLNIKYTNSNDVDLRLLSYKSNGKELFNQSTIVSPMQLACVVLNQKNLLNPSSINGFYLNGNLYYQVQFIFPQGYTTIADHYGMLDTFQQNFADHLIDLMKYYQETLRRTIVFSQYGIENILVIAEQDNLFQESETLQQDNNQQNRDRNQLHGDQYSRNPRDNQQQRQVQNDHELYERFNDNEIMIVHKFIFLSIPTSLFPIQMGKQFIFANMKQNYCLQYIIMDVSSNILLRHEPMISYINHLMNMAVKLGEDKTLVKQYANALSPKECLRVISARSQQAMNFLYMCVVKTNIMTEALLSVFTLLKCGFLYLKHSTYRKILGYEINYFEFANYDRNTTWQTLLGHLQTYYQKPDNDSQVLHIHRDIAVRDYIIQQMPRLEAFMESQTIGVDVFGGQLRPLTLGSPNVVASLGAYTSQIASSNLSFSRGKDTKQVQQSKLAQSQAQSSYLENIYKPRDALSIMRNVDESNAKYLLIAAIHELQHLPRPGYVSEIDPSLPFLPQVLADSTSISPLCSSIKFSYKDQVGVDAGGMWRSTLSQLFDDLLGDCQLSNQILETIKQNNKFGRRELDFEELNRDNPNPPSLLKVVNLETETVLVPHYNGYVCLTSSSVFPRLTDKRSCLYYFGRLVSFCMIYSGKMPKFLHFNFWRSMVGGRLFIDERLAKMYARQLEEDPMFHINGTRELTHLFYPLTDQEINTLYNEYTMVWRAILAGQADSAEDVGVPDATVRELQNMNIDISQPKILREYASQALHDMKTGVAYAKAYSEFRNGFRHPFATSMAMGVHPDFRRYAQYIDMALEFIKPEELEALLTFDPHQESYLNRQYIIQNLLHRNINKFKLEQDDPGQVRLVERIMHALSDEVNFSHKNVVDMVFAATGQRTLLGTEITFQFKKPSSDEIDKLLQASFTKSNGSSTITPLSNNNERPVIRDDTYYNDRNSGTESEENTTGLSEKNIKMLGVIKEGSGELNPNIQKQFIVFHTCFSQIDIPYLYAAQLNHEQLRQYFKESIKYALDNGFAIM